MSNSSVSVLLALFFACATSEPREAPALAAPPQADAPEKPMITTVTKGLSEEHQRQKPLLDRIEIQSHNRMRATRTYLDGAQYLIQRDPNAPNFTEEGVAWSSFVHITPAGVERLCLVIRQSVLSYEGGVPPVGPSGDAGQITWVVNLDGQERVVRTASGNYNVLPAFVRELDEAVSQNVQQSN